MKINEKNLCAFATTPPFDLEGWLSKKGEVNKSWQKRWFVLKGNLLFYFEKRYDKEPIGVIILEGCTVELAEDCEQYCFQLIFHGVNNRTYYLSAESQESMEIWMKAITCSGYEYVKLMVAELQRQLAEIEENSERVTPGRNQQNEPPKPPPRRHNPFNRPAPSVPVSQSQILAVNNLNTRTLINELTPVVTIKPRDDSIQLPSNRSNLQSMITDSTLSSISSSSTDKIQQNTQQKNENIFKLVHEILGKPILKEFNERKLINDGPLITFDTN